MDIEASEALGRNIRHGLGASGEAWLRELPSLTADLARRWRITLGRPFELSFNYVARARRHDGAEAVFKIGPWAEELDREIAALRLYDGDGICRLLEADLTHHAMLLERLRPGKTLTHVSEQDDDEATRIAAGVLRRLWRPAHTLSEPRAFRLLAQWFRAFERHRTEYGGPGPFPPRLLEHAERIVPPLLESAPAIVLLHGDFHHTNVLSAERQPWLAIDPKGMLGDPGYDVGPFLLNPWSDDRPQPPDLLRRRLDILAAELSYDRGRLRDWGIAHAVLSACWSAENGGSGWQGAIGSAHNLLTL